MMSVEGLEIRCPRCNWFLVKLRGHEVEASMTCGNQRCRSLVLIKLNEGKVAMEATPKVKQAN